MFEIHGAKVTPRKAKPKETFGDVEEDRRKLFTSKIFMGCMPEDMTVLELRTEFEQYGKVENVMVFPDRLAEAKRTFGFVVFQSFEAVENVMRNYFDIRLRGKWVTLAFPRSNASE